MTEHILEFEFGKVTYYLFGRGPTLVFLHGWGQDHRSFEKSIFALRKDYQILNLDLPGFGVNNEILRPLDLNDYVFMLKEIIEESNLSDVIIIGHSFGGRIAIKYASIYHTKALILVSSAGIRRKNLSLTLKILRYKVLKRFYRLFSKSRYQQLLLNSGSRDYLNASFLMKQTMSKIIRIDLRKDLKKVKSPTYLLWGIYNQETPYKDTLLMQKYLSSSFLIPFYNSGHFCFLDEENKFTKVLNRIISEVVYGTNI